MGKHQDLRKIKARADEYADRMILNLIPGADPRVKALSRQALVFGWVAGYATAMADAVTIREAALAVKH